MVSFRRFRENRGEFRHSTGFKVLSVLLLILAIPITVLLVLTYQTLTSNASTGDVTRLEIFGPSVSNGVTTSRNIKLRLIYVPATTPLRASLLKNLSPVKTAYAAGCNPLGGIDPATWSLIEKHTCDPSNPGTAGEEWACFGSDGTPKAVKFSNDVSDTARCPLPKGVTVVQPSAPSNACLPGCCGGAGNVCGSCPNGQACSISNGACQSGLSCNPNSCTYSQQDSDGVHCYSGVCSGTDCGFNKNCKYDPATTKQVDCPGTPSAPSSGGPSSGFGLLMGDFGILPATPVSAASTDYGMQIDIRDNQKVPTADQIAKLNPKWVRFTFPCINSQANGNSCPKDYHSTNLLGSVPAGVKRLAVITGDTTWNAPIGSNDIGQWQKYVDNVYVPTLKKIITDYGSSINAVELWNEEDINAGASYDPYIPYQAYAYLVSKATPAVKGVNPHILVVTGGLGAGYPFYIQQAITYIQGAFNGVDAIAIHPYEPPNSVGQVTKQVTDLSNAISNVGLSKPIWVTEIGIQEFSSQSSPKNQSEFLTNVFNQFKNMVPRPAMVNWYAFIDSMAGADGSTNWGLYRSNGTVKDVGNTFASFANAPQPAQALSAAAPVPVYPTSFRVANSLTDLTSAPEQTFDQNNKEIDWTLPSGNGQKTVYVQFKVSGSWTDIASSSITLQEPQASSQSGEFAVGVNMESAASYGYPDLRPVSKASDLDTDLKAVAGMNGSVIRVFVGNDKISDAEASKRLGALLDKAAAYNISVIPVLIDFYSSGHNPQGTDRYYTDNFNGISLLGEQFFSSGYKNEFKNFVQTVVSDNKNHSNIYAWEIGNELKDSTNPANFVSFMEDMAKFIKSIDTTHKVATGMIYSGHTGLTPDKLYPQTPDIDIITVHPYDGDRTEAADVSWAVQNKKTALVEEIGFSSSGDRSSKLSTEISFWKSQGASAVLPWGFIAKGLADNGDGDKSLGFDAIFHSDYDAIYSLLKSVSTPPSTSASSAALSCSQCILKQRTDLLPFYKQNGWDTSEGNYDAIVNNWCSAVSSQATSQCNSLKTGACSTSCNAPSTGSSASTKNQFDLNGDGKVNSVDIGLFIKIWQSGTNTKVADFNNDGAVNVIDFGILLKNMTS